MEISRLDDLHQVVSIKAQDRLIETHYVGFRRALIFGASEKSPPVIDPSVVDAPIQISQGIAAPDSTVLCGEHLYFHGGTTYRLPSKNLKIVARSVQIYGEGAVTFDLSGLPGANDGSPILPKDKAADGVVDSFQYAYQRPKDEHRGQDGSVGQEGHAAGPGGAGGFFELITQEVQGSFIVNAAGGRGAIGGQGGKGGDGGNGSSWPDPPADSPVYSKERVQEICRLAPKQFRGGHGGKGGRGGAGGNGGLGGRSELTIPKAYHGRLTMNTDHGEPGQGGVGGNGGMAGNGGHVAIPQTGFFGHNVVEARGTAGDTGALGGAGDRGTAPTQDPATGQIKKDNPVDEDFSKPLPAPFLSVVCQRLLFEYHVLSTRGKLTDDNDNPTSTDMIAKDFTATLEWLSAMCATRQPPIAPVEPSSASIDDYELLNLLHSVALLKSYIKLGLNIWGRDLESVDTLYYSLGKVRRKLDDAVEVERQYFAAKVAFSDFNEEQVQTAYKIRSLIQKEQGEQTNETKQDEQTNETKLSKACHALLERISSEQTTVIEKQDKVKAALLKFQETSKNQIDWEGFAGICSSLGVALMFAPAGTELLSKYVLGSAMSAVAAGGFSASTMHSATGGHVDKKYVIRKITAVSGSLQEVEGKMKTFFQDLEKAGGEEKEMLVIDRERFLELCDTYLDKIGKTDEIRQDFEDLRTHAQLLNTLVYSYNAKLIQFHKAASDNKQAAMQKAILQVVSPDKDEAVRRLFLLRNFYQETYHRHKIYLLEDLASLHAGLRTINFESVDYLAPLVKFGCFGAIPIDGLLDGWKALDRKLEQYRQDEGFNQVHQYSFTAHLGTAYPQVLQTLKEQKLGKREFTVDLMPQTAIKRKWISNLWRDVRLQHARVYLDGATLPNREGDPMDHRLEFRLTSPGDFIVQDLANPSNERMVHSKEVTIPSAYYLARHDTPAAMPVNETSTQFVFENQGGEKYARFIISPYTSWTVEIVDEDAVLSHITGIRLVFDIHVRTNTGILNS